MKKHLFISLLGLLVMFLLIGCGSAKTGAIKIEDGKIYAEGADSFICEIKKDGTTKTVEVNSGDSIDVLGLGLGKYELRAKAGSNDYSDVYNYESNKLQTPKNVKIEKNKIYFDEVVDADKYEVTFSKGEEKVVKELKSGALLTNLNLAEGTYEVYVVAKSSSNSDATSDASAKVSYTVTLEALDAPTGLAIEDGYIFFDIMGSTENYVIKFVNGDTVIEREIGASAMVAELLIPEGTYEVSIKAKGDGVTCQDSEYSEPISYVKEKTFMELKEKDLVNGGYIKWMGRTYYNEDKKANEVYHSASGFELFFKGTTVVATITATNSNSSTYRPYIVIVVDDDFDNAKTMALTKATQEVVLVENNNDLLEHKVDLYKRSESIDSHIAIESIKTDGVFVKKIVNKELKLEFIAASSSTGYGNLGSPSSSGKTTENSDALHGFAFLTAQALDADINIFSASGWGCAFSQWTTPKTANVPDEYKMVDFKSSVPWIHGYYVPDVVVVNLGTNDWSYINAAKTAEEKDNLMNEFQKKYIAFLKDLHDYYPDAQIIVLYGLMNETSMYEITQSIVNTARIAIPNIASIQISGDAGGYNSHPSLNSHKIIAEKLTKFIKETIGLE